MRNLPKYLLFILFAVGIIGCKKEPVKPPVSTAENTNPPYIQNGTPFTGVPENDDIVMYEANIRAMSVEGDLNGVITRLDEIKALGVNVIWLMPIHPVGILNGINSPYCVRDYKLVGAEYGNADDLRKLTTAAHQRGMAVILDWVANHTSWDHGWITAHKDWYTLDGLGNIISPPGTGWNDVADLNFDNLEMRAAMIDAMKYWVLRTNVDGFRCDHADGVPFDFWQDAITNLRNIPDRQLIFLAEGTRLDHFQAGFDLNFGWTFYGQVKNVFQNQSATNLWAVNENENNTLPTGKQQLRFTTNHDESAWDNTPMVLFNGEQGALAASVVNIFTGGVPLFYSSQEVGRTSILSFFNNTPINWTAYPQMKAEYQNLMDVYTTHDVARKGVNTNYSGINLYCIKKDYNGAEMLIFVNVRNNDLAITIPPDFQNSTWTNAMTGNTMQLGTSGNLSAYEYWILLH